MKRLLLALGALALAAGCSSSSSSTTATSSGSTGRTTATTTTTTSGSIGSTGSTGHGSTGSTGTTSTNGSNGTTGTTGTTGTNGTNGTSGTNGTTAGACTEITPTAFQSAGGNNLFLAGFTPDVGVSSPDQMGVFVFADDAGAFPLSAQDCISPTATRCVLAVDPLVDGGTNKIYYDTAGTMTVTQSDMANLGLTGSLSDVTMREFASYPDGGGAIVAGGECLHITNAAINVASFDAGPPPPPVDAGPLPPGGTCTTALPMTTQDGGFFFVSGDTSTSHGDEYNSSNCGGSGPDLFYSFTVPANASVTATLTPVAIDGGGGMAADVDILNSCNFGPDAGSYEQACSYTATPGQPVTAVVQRLPPGTYYAVADGRGGSSGPFSLTVSLGAPVPAPVNDTCGGGANGTPIPLVLGQTVTGDTTAATDDYRASGFPDDGGGCFPLFSTGQANDVVYSFTPVTTGQYKMTMVPTLAADGGGPDVAFYVVGTCPTGVVTQCVGGVDNYGPGTPETLVVNLTAATPYLIIADGYRSTDVGPFSFNVVQSPDGGPPTFPDGGGL
jgi:hypothetical protein